MRHFLASGPIVGLAGGVVDAALPALLIPPAGGVEGRVPGPTSTGA
jgi:hypothetical protein